jgi:hypothetical protein
VNWSTGPTPLATTDRYSDRNAVELRCPGASSIVLTVANAAASYQLGRGGRGGGSPDYGDDHFAVPGVFPITGGEIDAVRVRSAAAGVPANVAISAFA